VRAFVDEEVRPHAATWERGEGTPRALFRRAGAAGLFAWKFDPRWGGLGPDLAAQAVVVEELAGCGSGGVAADLGAHSDLAALYVDRAGTDAQRARWLAPSIAGDVVGALAITEPDAGSDVAGTRTRAVPDGDGWVLDGAKTYITNGSWCDYAVVLATTDPEAGHAGKTLFVVEAGTPGFERRRLRMLGWRSSHTGELSLAGVRVGDDHRLGEVGSGFLHVVRAFAWERVSMSLGAVVAAKRALAAAVAADAGAAPEVAALAVEVAAGRALAEHALRATIAEAADAAVQAAQAKLVTQRLAVRAADAALQRRPDDPEAARWLRDSRLGPIGGGTDEIMREIIGRSFT
jgi:acyl-CoA dehydrogenase